MVTVHRPTEEKKMNVSKPFHLIKTKKNKNFEIPLKSPFSPSPKTKK